MFDNMFLNRYIFGVALIANLLLNVSSKDDHCVTDSYGETDGVILNVQLNAPPNEIKVPQPPPQICQYVGLKANTCSDDADVKLVVRNLKEVSVSSKVRIVYLDYFCDNRTSRNQDREVVQGVLSREKDTRRVQEPRDPSNRQRGKLLQDADYLQQVSSDKGSSVESYYSIPTVEGVASQQAVPIRKGNHVLQQDQQPWQDQPFRSQMVKDVQILQKTEPHANAQIVYGSQTGGEEQRFREDPYIKPSQANQNAPQIKKLSIPQAVPAIKEVQDVQKTEPFTEAQINSENPSVEKGQKLRESRLVQPFRAYQTSPPVKELSGIQPILLGEVVSGYQEVKPISESEVMYETPSVGEIRESHLIKPTQAYQNNGPQVVPLLDGVQGRQQAEPIREAQVIYITPSVRELQRLRESDVGKPSQSYQIPFQGVQNLQGVSAVTEAQFHKELPIQNVQILQEVSSDRQSEVVRGVTPFEVTGVLQDVEQVKESADFAQQRVNRVKLGAVRAQQNVNVAQFDIAKAREDIAKVLAGGSKGEHRVYKAEHSLAKAQRRIYKAQKRIHGVHRRTSKAQRNLYKAQKRAEKARQRALYYDYY